MATLLMKSLLATRKNELNNTIFLMGLIMISLCFRPYTRFEPKAFDTLTWPLTHETANSYPADRKRAALGRIPGAPVRFTGGRQLRLG